jgi:hypothetical protein
MNNHTNTTTAGSTMVAALESAYEAVRANVPDLPRVVFITGTGLMARGAKWGHYGADRWVEGRPDAEETSAQPGRIPEVFIAGERLACGAAETFQTLLHEAVHALARVRGINEVSRDFRYHNKRFVAMAEELGLEWPEGQAPHPAIGFSAVVLAEGTLERYADTVAALDEAIVAHLDTFKGWVGTGNSTTAGGVAEPPAKPAPKSKRNNDKATCGCGRIIRASKKVLAEAPIICGSCGEEFKVGL